MTKTRTELLDELDELDAQLAAAGPEPEPWPTPEPAEEPTHDPIAEPEEPDGS